MKASADRLARAALSRVGEPGDPRLTGLVEEIGAETVLDELLVRGKRGDLHDALAERLATVDPRQDLADAARRRIRFVTPEDDEWPDPVADLAHVPALHERGGVPVGLWVRGARRLDEATSGAVAVVGSRSATGYGTSVAGEMAATVAGHGHPVVSGAAFGIDQAAHRGALATEGGVTMAVLACGVDRAYPVAHRELLEYVADRGLIVSEAAPGCAPTRIRFLARNRIIAALSVGTVVVEAAFRSGALNTANWAAGLSRRVMGVPGPVHSAPSEGVHQLIRTRDALLVTGGRDVLEAVGASGRHLLERPAGLEGVRDRLTLEQRQVLDAVPVRRAATVTSIARTAGVARARLEEALAVLGRAGLVERQADRWRLVHEPDEPGRVGP